MKLKRKVKRGLVVLGIYLIVTICLLLSSERLERLENNQQKNSSHSYEISLNKK